MAEPLVIDHARIVLAEGVVEGGVLVEDGKIQAILPLGAAGAGAMDFAGDYLLPGLVELHTDNLERQFQPRPRVRWPAEAALLAHDQQVAAAGITTVCDAVCVGFYGGKRERLEFLQQSIEALHLARQADHLKAEHFLHLRCEVSDPDVVEIFGPLCDEPYLRIVSLMDHTPGQRQWHDLEKYRTFHRGRTEASDAEFAAMIERRREEQGLYAVDNRRALLELVQGRLHRDRMERRGRKVVLASHDDTTPEHVAQAVADGVAIAEFPTTLAAAVAAREHGLMIVMGAPNVVLGGSHSGNVSALELARAGLLDGLSSDYVPTSLLHAAFCLVDLCGMALPAAIALISTNPARILRLDDRGAIAPGKRADLVRVRRINDTPAVLSVWRQGERIS